MIFHAASSLLIFFIWRITGMPSPGLLGRLVPLSWLITAIVYGRRGIPYYSIYFLAAFAALSLFWTVSPALEVISIAVGFAGIFPGLFSVSSRRFGILLAMLPVIPMILLLVPFTGDEPHYVSITESLISSESGRFSGFSSQEGDPVGNFTHHQSFYPALMIPGYPLSIPGMRGMNFLFALGALLMMSVLLRDTGYEDWKKLAVLAFLLVPGCSVLGLVYPGWLALAVFLSGVWASLNSKRTIWVIAAAIVLVLIKIRFIGVSVGLLAALIIELKGRRKFVLPAIIAGLAIAGLLFDLLVLNGRVFCVRYGNIAFVKTLILQPLYRTPEIIIAAGSSLVDIESGMLWKAPWVLAGLAGLPLLKNSNRKLFIWLGLPALTYYLILIFWTVNDWSGIPTPSGRMLLPLLPVLLASVGYMLKRKEVRILIWISLGISALYLTHPVLRFNHADGTDALVSRIFGPFSNLTEWVPSAVRLDIPVFAGWILLSAVIVYLIARRMSRCTEYTITSVFLLLCLFGGMEKNSWEAEDIPSEYRNFCTIYPDKSNFESRKYWLFTREQMLRLSNPEDEVILPFPETERESLRLEIFYRSFKSGPEPGIEVSYGEWYDSIYVSSEVMEAPRWVAIIKHIQFPERPENLEELRSVFVIPASSSGDSIRISALGMEGSNGRFHGIYLDRILFR
jgi:hypothetical protein